MLNRLALRLATVRALRGRTWAGPHVFDSESGSIDEFAADKPQPAIVVYTDDGQFHHGTRDLWTLVGTDRIGSGYQKLVIEIAMTQRMQVLDDEGEPFDDAVQPVTDAALEFNIDLIERQVIAALMDPSPEAQWAEIWRRFAFEVGDRDSQRGVSMRDGVRFAGRQMTLSVMLPKEPPPSVPIGRLWADFLALAETDPTLAPIVPALRSHLAGPTLEPWQSVQGAYGLTAGEAAAMRVKPLEEAQP